MEKPLVSQSAGSFFLFFFGYFFGISCLLEEEALALLTKGYRAKGKELPVQLHAAHPQEMLLFQQHLVQTNAVRAAASRHRFPHCGLYDLADNSSCSGARV